MNNTFFYSILKYRHSHLAGEVLNVGLLFIFPSEQYVHFAAPKKINRLKHVYYDINDHDIKAYLTSFDSAAGKLSKHLDKFRFDYNDLVSENFLIKDASALQFTALEEAAIINNSIEATIQYHYSVHLKYYQSETDLSKVQKHTESYILNKWKDLLKVKNPDFDLKLKKDNLEIKNEQAYFKANYNWENGSHNLVKAISFDLTDEHQINDRAILYYAKLNFLKGVAQSQNIRFDLLLGEPTDRKFSSAFNKAYRLLKTSEAPKKIIVEAEVESYANQVIDEAH